MSATFATIHLHNIYRHIRVINSGYYIISASQNHVVATILCKKILASKKCYKLHLLSSQQNWKSAQSYNILNC